MKEKENIQQKNIENLTELWKTVGTYFNGYHQFSEFEYAEVKDTQWPNRLWFHKKMSQENMIEIKEKLATISSDITIPIWHYYPNNNTQLFVANGFKLKFEQVGMSLKLETSYELNENFKLLLVSNEKEAIIWAELFQKSFGYVIGDKTVINTLKEVNYYIAFDGNKPVGTALTYETDKIIGAHSVGIPSENRRKGYANEIMKALINKGIENNNKFMVLQASEMGKGLYLKLGFQADFSIKNYVL
ncbi:GNAT family N-acetyltransferase [Tenacibaculum retecalamus]|uniref:GNAT family N-acetyltransferase n=1 Tax=Tenacibaculum retecalamus TaxID=3018315 RepID=UPI0023D945D1|nr:GNAT family N-acetyltransferase [Tenacibaculum retecalamus]WBX71081.1 GNAT family N-acetyltransferase [Tenacibaculum retecalamus]